MRLWTVHPRYLDAKGLVAAWREALLAQKVLAGETRGYTRHPQLERFRGHAQPLRAIAAFLNGLVEEAHRRGYNFDSSKIRVRGFTARIEETRGQLEYEWNHLRGKLRVRAPDAYRACRGISVPEPHPMFRIVPGRVRAWEKLNHRPRGVHLPGSRMRKNPKSALPASPPAVSATRMPRSHGGK